VNTLVLLNLTINFTDTCSVHVIISWKFIL